MGICTDQFLERVAKEHNIPLCSVKRIYKRSSNVVAFYKLLDEREERRLTRLENYDSTDEAKAQIASSLIR